MNLLVLLARMAELHGHKWEKNGDVEELCLPDGVFGTNTFTNCTAIRPAHLTPESPNDRCV